uniref:Uncharacterized protein n=1 Tax=Oryza glumipatula TaxID=40148 RepID=A0A0E0AV48_9ORYZ
MQPGDDGAGYRCGGATSATSTCARAARSRRPPWSTTCSRSARSRSEPSRRRRPPPRAAESATPAATACAASSTTPTTPTSTSTRAARSCAGASWCRTAATSSSASARRRAGLCGERSGRRRNFWAYRTYDDDGEPVYLHIACVKDGHRGRCAAARSSWRARLRRWTACCRACPGGGRGGAAGSRGFARLLTSS